jgi:purine-binding chemotaxis protein CheW
MERAAIDVDTRIVVVEVAIAGEPTAVGIIADKVHEVRDIDPSEVDAAPRVGMRWRPDFVKGIGKHNGDFVIIPDMDRIFEQQGAGRSPGAVPERVPS